MGYYRIIIEMTSVGHIPNNAVKTSTDKKQGFFKDFITTLSRGGSWNDIDMS